MIPYSIASYDLIVDVLAGIDFLEPSHAAYLKDKYLNYPFDYDSFCKVNTRKNYLNFFYASSHDFYIVQLLRNDVTYFYDHCTYDTAKKQLEKIIIDFRSIRCCRNESGCEYSYQLEKEIINSFIIVDDKANRKMNTAIVENRNKSIKLLKHASNGYLNWERFRNRILYTLNEDTTLYYTSIRKDGKII